MQGKVPDSTVFCCASPPKTDGQVFEAAVVAPHQDFWFQAALQRLGTTRNLSGKLHFSTRRGRDGDTLDYAAVQGLERMLRVKTRLETVSAGRYGVSGGSSLGCAGETVFETALATAVESTMDIELQEGHEFGAIGELGVSPGADDSAHATSDDFKGIFELHEVNESDLSKAEAAVAAATAGESEGEGNIRLFEVLESDFPPLPNSSHSLNSRLGSMSYACARRVACCVAAAPAHVCLGSSSPAVSVAVAHAHASILHGVRNSSGTARLMLVQRSTSYCLVNSWSDTVRVQGPTGTKRVKGGGSGPAEDLRPVSEVEAGGKFSAGRPCTEAGCRFTSREATRHRNQANQGGCGPHRAPTPPGPHQKQKLAKFGHTRMAKCQLTLAKCGIGQIRFGQMRPNKDGQIRSSRYERLDGSCYDVCGC